MSSAQNTEMNDSPPPEDDEGNFTYDPETEKLGMDLEFAQRKASSGISASQYTIDKSAEVHGTSNPTLKEKPFWKYMVNNKISAYEARTIFEPPNHLYEYDDPIWTFERFGATRTELPDGRVVYIGGEHEDCYDPDFYIYNDVTVITPPQAGETQPSIQIYGYPTSIFPQKDNHTSTYLPATPSTSHSIIIIGGLGYRDSPSRSKTHVYQLSLHDFSIHELATRGDGPEGGIANHNADLVNIAEGGAIIITTAEKKTYADDDPHSESDEDAQEDGGVEVTCKTDLENASIVSDADTNINEKEFMESETTYTPPPKKIPIQIIPSETFALRIRDWTWIPWESDPQPKIQPARSVDENLSASST